MSRTTYIPDIIKKEESERPGHFRETYRAYKSNQTYYELNFEDIKKRYGGKIIIVCKQKVISISNNFHEYAREIDKLDEDGRSEAYVIDVPVDNVIYMI